MYLPSSFHLQIKADSISETLHFLLSIYSERNTKCIMPVIQNIREGDPYGRNACNTFKTRSHSKPSTLFCYGENDCDDIKINTKS
jgi:hypothetical protein